MTFRLSWQALDWLEKEFPNAQRPKGIFVEYDMKTDFAKNHAQLERYIYPALLGFPNENDLNRIKTIEFVKTPEMVVTYTIENQHEQKEPLVSN